MVAPLLLGAYSAVESDEAFCASLWDCQTLVGKSQSNDQAGNDHKTPAGTFEFQ